MNSNDCLPNSRIPVASECVAAGRPIQGELPRALNGTLFRNGPNPQFPVAAQHWFTGDGMVHAFTLSDGSASPQRLGQDREMGGGAAGGTPFWYPAIRAVRGLRGIR